MSRRPSRAVPPARRTRSRRPSLEMLEVRELLTGFTVTTVADDGDNNNPTPGSLRAAIIEANIDPTVGGDTITFAIGSGVQTIAVPTALPTIQREVSIDGNSQPGFAGTPLIVIDGSGAGAGASGLTIETNATCVIEGLSIVGFATNGGTGGAGIDLIANSAGATIEGNYLGLEPDGSTAKANFYGIEAGSSANTIGGPVAAERNVISGNSGVGVFLYSAASGNLVEGDYIGTDATGNNAVGNLYGVLLSASGNTVGGTAPGTGNLISGNVGPTGQTGVGVLFAGQATSNVVEGNKIGTNAAGMSAVANIYGVYFGTPAGGSTGNDDVASNTIGGTVAGAGNTISGNFLGITGNVTDPAVAGTPNLLIAGNTIGLNVDGNAPIPNDEGIVLGANGSTIGGTTAAARNVISGNTPTLGGDGTGLNLTGDGDEVLGNYIGLTAAGSSATGTGNVRGMKLDLTGSTIGGTSAGSGNVISGNSSNAIELYGNGGDDVLGNVIGLTATGASDPNAGNGIVVLVNAPATTPTAPLALNDTIGGTASGAGNTIANSGDAGFLLVDDYPTGITGLGIRGNTIYGSGQLGIDLNSTAVPIPSTLFVTAAGPIGGSLEVVGWFAGTPSTSYAIDLFANGADPSGYGEGPVYLGSVTVTTNVSGYAMFTPSFTMPATPYTSYSATYTGPDGNTSEFAANYPTSPTSPQADLTVVAQSSASTVVAGNSLTFTETVINDGPGTAANVMLADTLPTSLVNATVATTVGTATIGTNNVLSASLGSLASGQSVTVTITGDASQAGVIVDSPGVSSTTIDPNYSNNQASQSITVQPSGSGPVADLAISEYSATSSAKVGTNLTYVVTVMNNGPNISTNATINDFLPSGVTLVSAVPSQGAVATLSGNLLTENLGTIAIGGSATFIITVTPTAAGSIVNAANVSGNQFDPVSSNNSTTLTIPVTSAIPNINLVLSQTASATTGLVGQNQVFTVTITNTGTDAATDVTLSDSLPANINYVSSTPSQGTPAALINGSLVTNLGTLAPGASATFTLVVSPQNPGPFVNGASAYSPDVPTAPVAHANTAVISITSGPSVIAIVGQPSGKTSNSALVVTFDVPLNASTATNKANYKLVARGKNNNGPYKTVTIRSVTFNAANNSVTITPTKALDPTQYYQIQIIGSTSTGIADIYGRRLVNPQYTAPGANFSAIFFAGTFPQG